MLDSYYIFKAKRAFRQEFNTRPLIDKAYACYILVFIILSGKKMKKKSKKTTNTPSKAAKPMATAMCCPLTGAPLCKLIICTLLCFAFIFGFGFILHGKILAEMYEESKPLWRTVEEMQLHFKFMLLTQFITAFVISALYSKYCGGCGLVRGLRFGLLIGILFGTMSAAAYAWMPITADLARGWFFGGLAEGVGLGMICWLTFKSCESKEGCN